MSWYSLVGIALAPFMAAIMVFLFARPVKNFMEKHLAEGWLKRILFFSWRV